MRAQRGRMMRTIGIVVAVMIGIVALSAAGFAVLIAVLLSPQDGDALAREQVDNRARAIAENLGYWSEGVDAETLAAHHFTSSDGKVQPFAWSGDTSLPDGADVDVIISARVDPVSQGVIFQRRLTPGAAEKCFRFHVRSTEYVSYDERDCAVGSAFPTPSARPEPALAPDTAARVSAVLSAADAASLESVVRAAFPEPGLSIDTTVTPDGELVAAVGIAGTGECVVRVRRTDGTVEPVSFDRIQLAPGEMGCRVELYTAPPL
ncbi:hypothetical protein [Microbacterium memoriense]|uniref:Uncharacterized protein n=1 Tax=Microbacterium memoriense TaxID=2978350 RepID=A0ABT2PAM8_9MICO|nr:hypothetical protein [Microbacterium memoriense]MCT9001625.1 hypothetical protein [Microbacterium memoriense]